MSKHLEAFLKRNRELAEALTAPEWAQQSHCKTIVQTAGRRKKDEKNGGFIIAKFFGPDAEQNAAGVAASRTSLPLALEMLEDCVRFLERMSQGHRELDDGWYSCPKADNYISDAGGTTCNCGTDKIREALAAMEEKAGRG